MHVKIIRTLLLYNPPPFADGTKINKTHHCRNNTLLFSLGVEKYENKIAIASNFIQQTAARLQSMTCTDKIRKKLMIIHFVRYKGFLFSLYGRGSRVEKY